MKKLLLIAFLMLSVSAAAQRGGRAATGQGAGQIRCIVGGGAYSSGEEDLPTPRNIDRSGFVYARVRYHTLPWSWHTREVPWHHDYPDGDSQFPSSLARLTSTHTNPDSYQIVDIDSKELFNYPFVFMSEPGFLDLYPEDARNLREYLDRGGFVLMDDFRGEEMDNLRLQMAKVYPDREILPVADNHPIFHSFFEIEHASEMVPPYVQYNSGPLQFLAISDPKGRIQVMVDYNNDISEYWEALAVGVCSLHEATTGVELGVNYAIYAMTH
jgi:hypothetical protein